MVIFYNYRKNRQKTQYNYYGRIIVYGLKKNVLIVYDVCIRYAFGKKKKKHNL